MGRTDMSTVNLPAVRACRPAWNKGRRVGQKRPLLPKHVWVIRVRLEIAGHTRDLALFNLAIDSKLRRPQLVFDNAGPEARIALHSRVGRPKRRSSLEGQPPKRAVFVKPQGSAGAYGKIRHVDLIGDPFEHVIVAFGRNQLPGVPGVVGSDPDAGQQRSSTDPTARCGDHDGMESRQARGESGREADWMSSFR